MITKTCFVAAALALAACRGERQASAAAADTGSSGPAVGGVGTAVAALQPVEPGVAAIGIVTPPPGHFPGLSAPRPTPVPPIFVARRHGGRKPVAGGSRRWGRAGRGVRREPDAGRADPSW